MEDLLLPIVLRALFLIHIGGAIVGFGPVFTFMILAGRANKAGPAGAAALLEGIVAIEHSITVPVATFAQPLSGIGLIFLLGWSTDFFAHTWLWVALVIYVVAYYIAVFHQTPTIARMAKLLKAGPPTPEFAVLAARASKGGPTITVLVAAMVVLMILKPGG